MCNVQAQLVYTLCTRTCVCVHVCILHNVACVHYKEMCHARPHTVNVCKRSMTKYVPQSIASQ